jgi:hypothetical protein
MKTIVLLLIAAATMWVTAGCEEEHEHHAHYGGAYDGEYHGYGHESSPAYHGSDWDRDDDGHPR